MASGENLLVGLITLALVAAIGWRIVRGVRSGRLPLYRSYIERDGERGKYFALLGLHAIGLALIAFIAADLLLGLGFRD